MAVPVNMTSLESLFNIANGEKWNFTSMNQCLAKYHNEVGPSLGFPMLVGHAWNFTRHKETREYLVDPCDTANAGVHFAGVACECPTGGVGSTGCIITSVCLPCGGLQGSATQFLTHLSTSFTDLQLLDLGLNSLEGTIPACLGDMTKLKLLFINVNNLNGQIPTEIQRLGQLELLNLHTNALIGSIPKEINNMVKLSSLILAENQLSENIPYLGGLTNLHTLVLQKNLLTGTIPVFIGNFKHLSTLDLSDNKLKGDIPSELFECRNLTSLYLQHNDLTGSISRRIADLTSLKHMSLSNNSLTGHLLSEFEHFKKMEYFDLGVNNFGGTIPEEISLMAKLQILNLNNNRFRGTMPQHWAPSLMTIDLSNNHLSGTIPRSFTLLYNLTNLILQNNFLETDPESGSAFGFLAEGCNSHLAVLDIANNAFTGAISNAVFGLPSLQTLFIGSNCFSGSLPSNMCNAPALKVVGFTDVSAGKSCRNGWEGIFKGHFTGFQAKFFLTGQIPQCLFQMPFLKSIHAAGNALSGSLPLSVAPQLHTIVLPNNKIYGTISQQLARSVHVLDLSHNMIGGTLDAFKYIDTDKTSILRLGVNHLSGNIPESLYHVPKISILVGNVLACKPDSSDLPRNDLERKSYQCGSSAFNSMLYVFAGMIFVAMLAFLRLRHSAHMQAAKGKMKIWLNVAIGKTEIRTKKPVKVREIIRYSYYLQMLRWFSIFVGAGLIVVEVVFLWLFRGDNVTLVHSYAWVLTGAFFSGKTSTMAILVAGILYCLYIAGLIYQYEKSVRESPKKLAQEVIVSEIASPKDASFRARMKRMFMPALRIVLLMSILLGAIFGGNILYVRTQLSGTSTEQTAFKLAFAAFKLFWQMSVMPKLFEIKWLKFGVQQKYHTRFVRKWFGGRMILFFLANIISTLIIPLVTVFMVDPACFRNYFLLPPSISITYNLSRCEVYNVDRTCSVPKEYYAESDIRTPFVYNYTCIDAGIKLYVPFFQQMFILLIFRSTVFFLYLCWDALDSEREVRTADRPLQRLFINAMPTNFLMKSSDERREYVHKGTKKEVASTKKYKGNNRISEFSDLTFRSFTREWITHGIPSHLSNLLVCITFGFLAPPLGLMAICCIVMDSYVSHLVLGRFLINEYSVIVEAEKLDKYEDETILQSSPEKLYVSPVRKARMQQAIQEIHDTWGAYAAIQAAESACEYVPNCTLAEVRTILIMVPAIIIAFLVHDAQNKMDKSTVVTYWALVTMLSSATAIEFVPWVFKKVVEIKKQRLATKRTGKDSFDGEASDLELAQMGLGGLRGGALNENGIESINSHSDGGESEIVEPSLFGLGSSILGSSFGWRDSSNDRKEGNEIKDEIPQPSGAVCNPMLDSATVALDTLFEGDESSSSKKVASEKK